MPKVILKNPPLVATAIIISVIALGALLYMNYMKNLPKPSKIGPEPTLIHPYQTQDKGNDRAPSIAYGKNQWVIVWQSTDDQNKSISSNKKTNIIYSVSSSGKTWTKPGKISSQAKLLTADNISPHIATDSKGNWLVVWESMVDLGTYGADRDLLEINSNDNASSWSGLDYVNIFANWDQTHSTTYNQDINPRVASDGSTWMVVWEGNSWAKSGDASDCASTIPWKPDFFRVYVQHRNDLSSKWKKTICLQHMSDKTFEEPAVAAAKTGDWLVPFSSDADPSLATPPVCTMKSLGNDNDILVGRTSNQQFGSTTGIWGECYPGYINDYANTDQDKDRKPAIATNGNVWIATWSLDKGVGAGSEIYVATSNDAGKTWGKAKALIKSNKALNTSPAIAASQTGNKTWAVVWQSEDDLGGSIGNDTDILISTSTDDGVTWSKSKPLVENYATVDTAQDTVPQIATDGTTWVIVWETLQIPSGSKSEYDIALVDIKIP